MSAQMHNDELISEISAFLPRGRADIIIALDAVNSTNDYLRNLADKGAPDGQVVTADFQTCGKGRSGKRFASPRGKGVYMSVLFRMDEVSVSDSSALTAWVAVAVSDALYSACGVRPAIKWVNDLVLGNKKICGILTETRFSPDGSRLNYAVVGIGVNLDERADEFPAEIRDTAASVYSESGVSCDRARLIACIVEALDAVRASFPLAKQSYLDAYRKFNVTLGKEVRVLSPLGEYTAFAEAIDDEFGLVVRQSGGETKVLRSGEVSVRGLYNYV